MEACGADRQADNARHYGARTPNTNPRKDQMSASADAVVSQRYYVSTGKSRVTVDAPTAKDAAEEAIERIVSDESNNRPMGRLVMISRHGFDSEADDDLFTSTESVLERIGFRRDAKGNLVRCKTCRGVGRLDCCDRIDCLDCGGLFTKDCPDC